MKRQYKYHLNGNLTFWFLCCKGTIKQVVLTVQYLIRYVQSEVSVLIIIHCFKGISIHFSLPIIWHTPWPLWLVVCSSLAVLWFHLIRRLHLAKTWLSDSVVVSCYQYLANIVLIDRTIPRVSWLSPRIWWGLLQAEAGWLTVVALVAVWIRMLVAQLKKGTHYVSPCF